MHATIEALIEKGTVTAEDVRTLRGKVFKDGVVSRDEAAQLIFLARHATPKSDRAWGQYLSEAVTDYLIRQQQPLGFMSDTDGQWLIALFGDPVTAPETLVDMLCHILENATQVPAALVAFGIEAVKAHILADGIITAREVMQLSTLLYAKGGAGHINITKEEASLLFDLNDASRHSVNSPAWEAFFAKAIAAYVMAHTGYTPPTREEALRVEEWLNSPNAGVAGLFSQMLAGGLSALFKDSPGDAEQVHKKRNSDTAAAATKAAQLTEAEIDWLAERIGRDSHLDKSEQMLLDHLKSLSGSLPAQLAKLAS